MYNGTLREFVVIQLNCSCLTFILHVLVFVTGPGALVAIVNPPLSDKFLGGGSTPILTSARPFLILNDNFHLIERPIAANGTDTNGYILNNIRPTPDTLQVDQTGCARSTCDQQSLLTGNILMKRCACMQMDKSEKVICS